MSFWGASSNQKNAQGSIAEIPRWVFDQMKQGYARDAEAWLKANGYNDEYVANLRQQIDQGLGTPEQIRATGQQISPGINDLITRRNDRLTQQGGNITQQQANYNGMPDVGSTIDDINANQRQKGEGIGNNWQDIQGTLDNSFGQQRSRTAVTADTIGNDTAGTFGSLRGNSDTAFGDARSSAAAGFGRIGANTGAAFKGATQRINQGRDFQLGTTARAFAPAMAATLRRIRASGIDPNSPEAASLLQRVDAARGHAFDDSMQGTLDKLNTLDISSAMNQQGLDLSKLSNDQVLALQNAANKQGLSLDEYAKRSGLARETRDIQNGLDQNNMSANVQNLDTAFQRGQDFLTERQKNDLISRGLRIDDTNNRNSFLDKQNGLLDKQNQSELTDQQLLDQQFGQGANLTGANQQVRANANTQLGQAGHEQYGISAQQGQQGSANAGQASQGFGQSYGIEAQNSGWGRNLIAGIAGGAANVFLPGSGGFVSGAISGKPQGGGGFGALTNPFAKKTSGGGYVDYGNGAVSYG